MLQKIIGAVMIICVIAFFYFLVLFDTTYALGSDYRAISNTKEKERITGMIGTGIGSGICIGLLLLMKKR